MNRLVRGWPWLLLFGSALVFAIAAGSGEAPEDSPVPSVHNPGPRGAKVLATWLSERGSPARILDAAGIPEGLETLVVATAPGRPITDDETAALRAFAQSGGTLLYFVPRPPQAQAALAQLLELKEGPPLAAAKDAFGDVDGAVIGVTGTHRFLAGVKDLRFTADTGLAVEAAGAEQLAGSAMWRIPLGRGEVIAVAGADLMENRRLDLAGNAQFWANIAARPVAIFEHLLDAGPVARWSLNLWATLAQFVFVALLFVAGRAQRLGPPRPVVRRQHRSSLEYVASMAGLMARAHVDGALAAALRSRLRRLMHDRLGIALNLPSQDASLALAQQTGLPPNAWVELDRRLGSSVPFVALAAEAARLEDAIVGRRAA